MNKINKFFKIHQLLLQMCIGLTYPCNLQYLQSNIC